MSFAQNTTAWLVIGATFVHTASIYMAVVSDRTAKDPEAAYRSTRYILPTMIVASLFTIVSFFVIGFHIFPCIAMVIEAGLVGLYLKVRTPQDKLSLTDSPRKHALSKPSEVVLSIMIWSGFAYVASAFSMLRSILA